MPRYFIEVAYKGTGYSGFQIQMNAITIQSEVEKALKIYFRKSIELTGASRTDAGVHALQNYFHFDVELPLFNSDTFQDEQTALKRVVYPLNSLVPHDIVIKSINRVKNDAHCRFDAISREYKYYIYRKKNPFYNEIAFFYPYKIDIQKMQEAANIILITNDFTSFSKRNTQVKNLNCSISKSEWIYENEVLIYNIIGNRFLRGMVRGLVGTILMVGSGKISLEQFADIIKIKDATKANFSIPARGLFLIELKYKSSGF